VGSAALRGPLERAPEGSRGLQRTGPARGESQAGLGRPSESLILCGFADRACGGFGGFLASCHLADPAVASARSRPALTRTEESPERLTEKVTRTNLIFLAIGLVGGFLLTKAIQRLETGGSSPSAAVEVSGGTVDRESRSESAQVLAHSTSGRTPIEQVPVSSEPNPTEQGWPDSAPAIPSRLATTTDDGRLLRDLKGAEREKYLRDHRLDYMRTHRDAILRTIPELDSATSVLEANQKAYFLAKRSICLLLDSQNRQELLPVGVPVSIKSEGDNYCFQSGNWVYRFTGTEFPEWVYLCEIRAKKPPGQATESSYPSLPAHVLAMLHQRAATALSAYPGED
jgi:hypothetical protein